MMDCKNELCLATRSVPVPALKSFFARTSGVGGGGVEKTADTRGGILRILLHN